MSPDYGLSPVTANVSPPRTPPPGVGVTAGAAGAAARPARREQEAFPRVERDDVLSDRVASMLLERVLLGELQPGEELPSERELSDQLGVSRTVVREAIRSLTGRGVIDARSGRKARIGLVGRDHVVETMRLYLRGRQQSPNQLPYSKIHEVRRMLELTMVELAAKRGSAADRLRLRQAFEQMRKAKDNLRLLPTLDVEFHRVIAEMTGNELFVILMDSIGDIMTEIREQTLGLPGRPASALKYHAAILEAIEGKDARSARRAMEEHLRESASVWSDQEI